MRTAILLILVACAGCKKADKKEVAVPDAAPKPKPQVELQVRTVVVPSHIFSGPMYDESWTPSEGYKFVVVEAEVRFNRCEEDPLADQMQASGDAGAAPKLLWANVRSQDGWLVTADARRIESIGGGGGPSEPSARTCVGCETTTIMQCDPDPPGPTMFRFVFGVESSVDPSKLTLEYRDARASLAGAPAPDW